PALAGGIVARRATMGLRAKPAPLRAASAAAPKTAAPQPSAGPAPPKHPPPPGSRARSGRLPAGAGLGGGRAMCGTMLVWQLLDHYLLGLPQRALPLNKLLTTLLGAPLTAPLALGLLAFSAVAAGLGALAGTGGPSWKGRLVTSLAGALLGLAAVLLIGGP